MALLLDQYTLSQDQVFQHRVQEAILSTINAIHNEAFTAKTSARDAFGKVVIANMGTWLVPICVAVATDSTIGTQAGSPPVTASVTDAAILNAVSAMWDTFSVRD